MASRGNEALEDVLEPTSDAVFRRLEDLGIPPEVLSDAVRVGHIKGDFTTAAHPVTYPGMVVWGETTAALRSSLASIGWSFDDTDCIARAISPNGEVSVVAVRGNEHTGIRNKHEYLSTRRRRGSAGVRVVKMNMQYVLQLEEEEPTQEVIANLGGTWFLLYNRVGDIVRAELSFAKAVSKSGDLLQWRERLILPEIDLLAPSPRELSGVAESTPEVDVPVSRRAS